MYEIFCSVVYQHFGAETGIFWDIGANATAAAAADLATQGFISSHGAMLFHTRD